MNDETQKKPHFTTQPTAAPTRKVAAGGIGTSAGAIIGWATISLITKFGMIIPPEIEGEIYALSSGLGALIVGFASAYMTRDRSE